MLVPMLAPDLFEYLLISGYGLTESCACCTIMDGDENSTGRTGPPLQGVLVKLIDWDEGNYRVSDDPPRGILPFSYFPKLGNILFPQILH